MHDIWNPWHGCTKISEGCANCYMYFLDKTREKDGAVFHPCKSTFNYPLKKGRDKQFKVKPGEMLRVCMTSDFFLEDADPYRKDVWDMIRYRSDVVFWLLTKRAHRISDNLPEDWKDGYDNVWLNVTAENQARADERVQILLSIPAKHKGVNVAPFIGPVSLAPYLATGQIDEVGMGGENYDGCRPCYDEWVHALFQECVAANVRCHLYETGTRYVKNGQEFWIPNKTDQSEQALYSGYHFHGHPVHFDLKMPDTDMPIPDAERYRRLFGKQCETCGNRWTCNGCAGCGQCRNFTKPVYVPGLYEPGPYTF